MEQIPHLQECQKRSKNVLIKRAISSTEGNKAIGGLWLEVVGVEPSKLEGGGGGLSLIRTVSFYLVGVFLVENEQVQGI